MKQDGIHCRGQEQFRSTFGDNMRITNGQIEDNKVAFGFFWVFMTFLLYSAMDNHFENHETKHQTVKK